MPKWLSIFGKAVLEGAEIVMGVAPINGALNPKLASPANMVSSDLQQLISTIQQVEVVGQKAGLTGAQKLQAAAPIVRQQVLQLLNQWGFSVQDQNRFAGATQGLTSVLADILNTVQQIKSA